MPEWLATTACHKLTVVSALPKRSESMPQNPQVLIQQGIAAQRSGRLTEAARCYEAALSQSPQNFDALQLLGVVRFRLGDLPAGLRLMEQALAQVPNHGPTLNNYGNALRQAGRHHEALRAYQAALAALPTPNALLLRNLGSGYLEIGDRHEAGRFLEAACRLDPRDPVLWCWIGMLESMRDRVDAAIAAYREAQRLDPARGDAWYQAQLGLASAAISKRHPAQAERALAEILAARPTPLARVGWLQLSQRLANWTGWQREMDQLAQDASLLQVEHEALMQVLYASDDPKILRSCADAVARFHTQRAGTVVPPAMRPHARIKVGYLSGDIRNHVVAWLFSELLPYRNKTQFEVTVYALGPTDHSAVRQAIISEVDHFTDLGTRSAHEIHELIQADEIDILVDLAGYTEHARPRVLATRPAPIQVGWLGYPGTIGGQLLDYLIADPVVVPPELEADYAERIARLPVSCLPNHSNRSVSQPKSRAALGLPSDAVILCAFVPAVKITPPIFDVWMSILRARPAACLWLQKPTDEAMNNLRKEAEARGVSAQRLIFAEFEQDHDAHLARYAVADLALDTYPYGSHSTAADALWVGCPLVSRRGSGFAARVSSSALAAVGLACLVAESNEAYLDLVLELIDHAERRFALREHLIKVRTTCALFDAPRYASALDRAYAYMYQQAFDGQPTQSFDVEPE